MCVYVYVTLCVYVCLYLQNLSTVQLYVWELEALTLLWIAVLLQVTLPGLHLDKGRFLFEVLLTNLTNAA